MEAVSSSRPPIDVDALAAWIEKHLDQPLDRPHVERLGAGRSNLTFLLQDRAQRATDDQPTRIVVRRPPAATGLQTAHDVEREATILSALADSPVPVPQVLAVVTEPAVAGGAPVVLLEYIEGSVMDSEHALLGLRPSARRRVGTELAQTLARIHDVDVDAVGLGQMASREPYAPRQLRRWSRQWEHARTAPWAALEELTERLWMLAPDTAETALVHGDYGLANVLVGPGGTPSAVLDWELATLGHPLADLGVLLAYWGGPGEPRIGPVSPGQVAGLSSAQELVDAYVGTVDRALDDLSFWRALALWKLAIIGADVLRRSDGSPDAEGEVQRGRRTVEALVERAWTVLR